MSYLSEELERQFQTHNTNPLKVAEKCAGKISSSQIYKWVNRDQTSIGVEQMTALALAISKDKMEHARLVYAHLMDEKFGPGSNLVRVEIDNPSALNDRPKALTKGDRALAFLSELRFKSKDANEFIISAARNLGCQDI